MSFARGFYWRYSMGDWVETVNVKSIIDSYQEYDDLSPEQLKECANKLYDLLSKSEIMKDCDFLEDLKDNDFDGDAEAFDEVLEGIYDYADEHRVWMGP
jgi:hypothetical protein